jgi:hypothetical protein
VTRGALCLTVVFLGLAIAFAGFSLAATGRPAAASGAAVLGFALVAGGALAFPGPVRANGEPSEVEREATLRDA